MESNASGNLGFGSFARSKSAIRCLEVHVLDALAVQIELHLERAARDEIVKHWREFGAADKAVCILLATAGGTPTYTELLTCLELKRDARLLRQSEGRGDRAGRSR